MKRFTLSDYLHPDKALWPPEQPPKLALYVYPDHQKRYVPQMLHPFEGSHSHVLPDQLHMLQHLVLRIFYSPVQD